MLKRREWEGQWWRPENPNDHIDGRLRYDPANGLTLYLKSNLVNLDNQLTTTQENPSVLYGLSLEGHLITLVGLLKVSNRIFLNGGTTSELIIDLAYVGAHLVNAAEFQTDVCEFRLTNIEEFLDHRPFRGRRIAEGQALHVLEVNRVSPLSVRLGDIGCDLTSDTRVSYTVPRFRYSQISVLSWLRLNSDSPKTAREFSKIIRGIQRLSALLLGIRVYIENFVVNGDEVETPFGDRLRSRIDVYYAQVPSPEGYEQADRLTSFNIFNIHEDISRTLNGWIAIDRHMSTVTDLIYYIIYAEMFLNLRFLLAAQALESLHRTLWSASYVPQSDYDTLRRAIIASFPQMTDPALKQKLGDMLRYGNEFSLRSRLKDIAKKLEDYGLTDVCPLDAALINEIVTARNYYTHFDHKLESKIAKGADLHNIYVQILKITIAILLKETGLSTPVVTELLKGMSPSLLHHV